MGAYVSRSECAARGIDINCTITTDPNNRDRAIRIGPYERGNLPSEPDIAGIGVLVAFLIVTVVSLIASIISTIWWWSKHVFRWKATLKGEEREKKDFSFSFAGLLEAFVINCSDQQIFTGCAYAVTLRYVTGCSISAYHYDIVANMLLVTCATHLAAVTVSRNYWQDAIPAIVRIAITFTVYAVTGVLLSNQGAGSEGFPTKVPPTGTDYNDILRPAACFQSGEGGFTNTVQESFADANSFFKSKIPGWTQYLVMFICYVLAIIVRAVSAIHAGRHKEQGRRRRIVDWTRRRFSFFFRSTPIRVLYFIFGLYLVAGNAVGIWTVYSSANYVVLLRNWVDRSNWLQSPGELNPENNPNTFGQLVPMFLNLLLIFAILQFVSEQFKLRRARRLAHGYYRSRDSDEAEMAARDPLDPYCMQGSHDMFGRESKQSTFDVVVKPAAGVSIADPDAVRPDLKLAGEHAHGGKATNTLRMSSVRKVK